MKRYLLSGCIAGALAAAIWLVPRTVDYTQLPTKHPELTAENPLRPRDTVNLEEMTWMEVRDAIARGSTRVVIPVGGIEQNGPYVALYKHNLIVRNVAERAARIAGNTLVAPVIPLSPEGEISPASGHMLFPGTISLRPETLVGVLRDTSESLLAHGFSEIVLIADSGDAQRSLDAAARLLANHPRGSVRFLQEFYNYGEVQSWVEAAGYQEQSEGIHDSLAFTAQLLAIDPVTVRLEERRAAGRLTLNGVSLDPVEPIRELGEEILRRRSEMLAALLRK